MKRLRSLLFWCHLTAGVVAGLVILIMSVTGALLAFKPQIQRLIDREVRVVNAPQSGVQRLGVQRLLDDAGLARPGSQVSSITLDADTSASAAVGLGREGTVYVDPYTGRVLGEGSKSLQAFFRTVEDWHRWLGASGENRATGRALTGAANLAFLMLALSGVYLWWPRQWLPQHVKAILMFRRQATGRARDFNWHNVIGFWCASVLVPLTASGVVMSYPWANDLLYRMAGSPVPSFGPGRPGGPGGPVGSGVGIPDNLDRLWARAEQQVPVWTSIGMRLPNRRGAPVAFTISAATDWNAFARSQLTLDSSSGEVVRWEPYANQSLGQRMRGWVRFGHTGELGGVVGQTLASLACVGGVFLVCTGLSLACRRLLGWRLWKKLAGQRARSAVAVVPKGSDLSPSAR